MTQQKDLKRLVRDRQARTGESYMTALRQVRSQSVRATGNPILVEELDDLTEAAEALGLTCRVLIQRVLADRVEPRGVLLQLREILRATAQDHAFDILRSAALYGEQPQFQLPSYPTERPFWVRVRAGIGGVSNNGRLLAFTVAGHDGPEMIMFQLWSMPLALGARPVRLIITTPDGLLDGVRQLEAVLP